MSKSRGGKSRRGVKSERGRASGVSLPPRVFIPFFSRAKPPTFHLKGSLDDCAAERSFLIASYYKGKTKDIEIRHRRTDLRKEQPAPIQQ